MPHLTFSFYTFSLIPSAIFSCRPFRALLFCCGQVFSTLLCIVDGHTLHVTGNAGNRCTPMKVAELSLRRSHHLACSQSCRIDELANRPHNRRANVRGQETAPVRTLKESATSSTSPLEDLSSAAPVLPQTVSPLVHVKTTTNVFRFSISTSKTTTSLVSEVTDFKRVSTEQSFSTSTALLRPPGSPTAIILRDCAPWIVMSGGYLILTHS